PWQGWQMTKGWTAHFHIKDWIAGEKHGCLAGEGQGRIPEVIAEVAQTYDGFATLEPHLLNGGAARGGNGAGTLPQADRRVQGHPRPHRRQVSVNTCSPFMCVSAMPLPGSRRRCAFALSIPPASVACRSGDSPSSPSEQARTSADRFNS